MKKFAIAIAVVLVVLVGVGFFAARNLNRYLEENREWIESQIQTVIGRPVEIGGLRASLGWGVSARVRDLAVADDPAFSKESFLRAGDALARVKLLPLLSGRVEVGRIEILRPEIRVIQSAQGMNIDSLGAAAPAAEAPAPPAEAAADPASVAAIAVALFRIDDATLLYRDTSATPASEIEVGGLDVDFSSDGNLETFRGRLDVAAAKVRLRSGESEDAQWEPVALGADLEREGDVLHIRSAEVRAASLRLALDATVRDLSGSPSVDATFSSAGGEVGGIPFEGLDGSVRYGGERASVESLVLRAFGGEIKANGVYNMRNPRRPAFEFDTVLDGIRVEQAIATQSETAARYFEGAIESQLRLVGAGADWESIRPRLSGGGEFHLVEGVLREVNLVESALGGLSGVPGLSDLLAPDLRAKYPALFGAGETRFDRVDAVLKIGGGAVRVEELALAARDFAIEGAGRIGLDGAVDLPTRLVCSEALGADLVDRQPKVAVLRGASGRVEFPLRLRGELPGIRAEPDVSAVARAVGEEKVRDLLGKALRGKQEGEETDSGAASGETDPSEELLKKGLDSLFGR